MQLMRKLLVTNTSNLRVLLKKEIMYNREARFLHRLHCVLLVADGYSCYEVARCFGNHPRTVERWVRRVQQMGVDGLRSADKSGRNAKLNHEQYMMLIGDVCGHAPGDLGYSQAHWDGQLFADYIERRYGIKLGLRQCQRLLKKICIDMDDSLIVDA